MKILRNKIKLKKEILDRKGIAFVPTMGALHHGHEKMIKFAKKRFGKVIVSIFVNPKQFNSKQDFKTYPRNIKKDIKLLKRIKVDILYLPSYFDIFSFKTKKRENKSDDTESWGPWDNIYYGAALWTVFPKRYQRIFFV